MDDDGYVDLLCTVGGIGLAGVIGGLIATNFGWQTNFIISIVIAFIAILLLKGTDDDGYVDLLFQVCLLEAIWQ
jgi:MFS family permease